MNEIICTSQKELDALSADYNGRVIIKFGTPLNRAVVKRRFIYPVVARDNSYVVAWALAYGATWEDLAILELECEKSDVLVPLYSDGKVRARKAKVLREVPLEECGLLGKIIAKRRANHE